MQVWAQKGVQPHPHPPAPPAQRLTPRQRRLEAQKRAWAAQQKAKPKQQPPPLQQPQPLQQQPPALGPELPPPPPPQPSVWALRQSAPLPPDLPQLHQLAQQWAAEASAGTPTPSPDCMQAGTANVCALAAAALVHAEQRNRGTGSSSNGSSVGSSSSAATTCGVLCHELAGIAWAVARFSSMHGGSSLEAASASLQQALDLPFAVLPSFLPDLRLDEFVEEVQLSRNVIYLDGGTRAVEESRLTGWQSDLGATFRYSETERVPQGPLTPRVAAVRDALRHAVGEHYDSVLINYYEDERCGMRFHADPLYGTWSPNTAVVSIGAERRFAFRATRDFSQRWQFPVRNGDVVVMRGDCQDRFQHSVIVEKGKGASLPAGPRMSLVFKQKTCLSTFDFSHFSALPWAVATSP